MPNKSPWIHQLNHERETHKLTSDIKTDIAVVGGGIAGVSTAFFLLKNTDKKVVVVEGYKLAHGATGHNAGQIASYFEKPFREIVKEFGLEMACQGQKDIQYAWELLDEMYTEAGLDIPLTRVMGYAGLSTKEQVMDHLENNFLRRKGGLYAGEMEIWEDVDFLHELPEKYHKLFSLVPREQLTLKLETFDHQYIAVLQAQKGAMNSALFCQEVVSYLLDKYKDRFSLYEHTHIKKVVLKDDHALLDAVEHTITCDQVILCTNGFDNFEILAPSGLTIDTRFHHNINGVVAYMSGYLEPNTSPPTIISYYPKENIGLTDNPGDPYFYMTRRSFENEEKKEHNLICMGGPDFQLEDRVVYDREHEFSETARKQLSQFIKHTYDKAEDLDYAFMWHGMMGYTKNLLRMIGRDPDHSHLLYNLGCNGVGILPSIFGGYKIAQIISGKDFPPSLFDITKRS